VKHAKRTGRGLKCIVPGQELEEEKEKKRLKLQQQEGDRSVALDAMHGECKEDCAESLQVWCPQGASPDSPYKRWETAYLSELADYIVNHKASQKMAQLLHAGLVATIGILYSLCMTQ
jgi:hypothetical protein